jgi:hypothetical protein
MDEMQRFDENDTVLINVFHRDDLYFKLNFRQVLHNAGLNRAELPYNLYDNALIAYDI